jgi:hypothetical protein
MGRPLPLFYPGANRDETLAREGWERRFVAVVSRLDEASELYEQLGFAVRLEPPTEETCANAATATPSCKSESSTQAR